MRYLINRACDAYESKVGLAALVVGIESDEAVDMAHRIADTFAVQRLNPAECECHLAFSSLARVVLSVACLPAAVPVHVDVVERHILFGCFPGPLLNAAAQGDVVTIEVDGEALNGATWSVLVTGIARIVVARDPLGELVHRDRLTRSIERGAVLVAVPLTHVVGEQSMWCEAP